MDRLIYSARVENVNENGFSMKEREKENSWKLAGSVCSMRKQCFTLVDMQFI